MSEKYPEKYLGASVLRDMPQGPNPSFTRDGAESIGTVEALSDRVSRLVLVIYNLRNDQASLHEKLFGPLPPPNSTTSEKLQSEPMGEYSRLVQKVRDLEAAIEATCDTFTNFRMVF